MRERPILFSAPMVRAILEGRKGQTRRVIAPQPPAETQAAIPYRVQTDWNRYEHQGAWQFVKYRPMPDGTPSSHCEMLRIAPCPYGVPGDRLWVKEATWIWCEKRPNGTTKTGRPKFRYVPVGQHVRYCVDGPKPTDPIDSNPCHLWKYKAARFMPRWASRITLGITDVRVQRVQEISEEDARAEGCEETPITEADIREALENPLDESMALAVALGPGVITAKAEYIQLWDSINAKRGYGWDVNPWVWCVTFRRIAR